MTGADRPGRAEWTSGGKVVTFYSYKGGTGRTTALANVAWILAANGLRVLVVDWDLEAPGLERYFLPFLDRDELANRTGVLDLVADFRAALARRRWSVADLRQLVPRHADVSGRVLQVDWPHFPAQGRLDLLCAGQEGPAYAEALADLDWNAFYREHHGEDFLRALGDGMAAAYDYVLIDSRTGLGDTAGICTLALPETLVVCFTLSGQGIDGAAEVAHDVARVRAEQGRPIRVLPVPTRVDGSEHERFEAGRDLARQRFAGFPAGLGGEALRGYWNAAALPYRAYYAFEEVLAVFGDEPGDPQSLLAGCERLTAAVTQGAVLGLPPMPEALRTVWRERFQRRRAASGRVVLLHGPAERAWARWAAGVLEAVGLQAQPYEFGDKFEGPDQPGAAGPEGGGTAEDAGRVEGAGRAEGDGPELSGAQRVVALLSEVPWSAEAELQLAGLDRQRTADGQALLVRARCGGEPRFGWELDLQQPDEQLAAQLLVRAVAPDLVAEPLPSSRSTRYPGREPSVWNAPGRNPFFSGRAVELDQVRGLLALHGRAVVLPERPGAGTTELAREYTHRHRGDYDLVWWIPAADPAAARAAFELLFSRRRGPLPARSLLVLDGADDPEALDWRAIGTTWGDAGPTAHVLVTSSLPVWAEHAQAVTLGRLARQASHHLLGRPQAAVGDGTDRLAARLEDHAPALFLASAYLAVTGQAPDALLASLDPEAEPTAAVLALTLALLEGRSPAALRVLRLCASLGGATVARRLLRDDRLLRELEEVQPEVMDWASFATVQGELEALGLVTTDGAGELLRLDARVRQGMLDTMDPAEGQAWRRRAHELLVARRLRLGADVDNERNWQRLEEIWAHLLPSGADGSDEPEVRGLFVDFVRYLRHRGRPVASERLAQALHARWTARLPASDWRRLRLRAEWANAVRSQGRHQEALELDLATLDAQRGLFGAEHVHTLITAGGVGGGLRALGRYQEALAIDRPTLAALTSRLGRGHPRTTAMINNLAVDLHLAGDYAAALEHHEEALRLRRISPGPTHPYTFSTMAGVARAVRELGRLREALDRYRQVSLAQEATPDLPFRLIVDQELAAALRWNGLRREALELASRVHAEAVRRHGADSPAALAALMESAAARHAVGAHEEAAADAAMVHELTTARIGPDHPETLCAGHNLALFLAGDHADAGRVATALAVLGPVVESLERRLGADHPLTLSARANRAGLLAAVGDYESALVSGAEVMEEMGMRRGGDHPLSLLLAANLSQVGLRAGRRLESERLRIEALPKLTRRLGRDHPDLAKLRQGRWVDVVLDLPLW